MRPLMPSKAQAKLGQRSGTRERKNSSPSFAQRRIPQEPGRFNGTLARLSFSVVSMSSTTSTLGERLTVHVVRLAPSASLNFVFSSRLPL